MKPVVSYDQAADVLYVGYTQEPADRGVDRDGIVRRYKLNGELAGVTILDFAEKLKAGAICA